MEQTYHQFILRAYVLHQKYLQQALADCALSPGQPRVLEYLYHHNGCMQKELAAGCLIEPASAAVALARLEREGLLTRQSRADDRRALHVFLTEEGHKKAAAVCRAMTQLEEQALSVLSADERCALTDALRRVTDHLTEMRDVSKNGESKIMDLSAGSLCSRTVYHGAGGVDIQSK